MTEEDIPELSRWFKEIALREQAAEDLLSQVWGRLEAANVRKVVLKYEGSGDSGGFEDLELMVGEDEPRVHSIPWGRDQVHGWDDLNLGTISVSRPEYNFATREHQVVTEESDLIMALVGIGEDFLASKHVGWENNDGGRGEVIFDVPATECTLEHVEYYTETNEYSYKFGGGS